MMSSFGIGIGKCLLLCHEGLALVIDAVLRFGLGEVSASVGHRLEHHILHDLALPEFLLLPLDLFWSLEGVHLVLGRVQDLPLDLGSRVGQDVRRLSPHLPSLISVGFLLLVLSFLLVLEGGLDAELRGEYG